MADYPDVTNALFVSKYGEGKNIGGVQRMNFRSELVKKALASNQYSHLVKGLEIKAAELHKKELDQWNVSLEDVLEADDVSLCVFTFSSSTSIIVLHFCFTVPAIRFSTPYILSSAQLARMLTVMFRSLSVTPEVMDQTMGFSLREFHAFFNLGLLLILREVFIGGLRIAPCLRLGRNGIQRDLTPESPVRSSNMLQNLVRCFIPL